MMATPGIVVVQLERMCAVADQAGCKFEFLSGGSAARAGAEHGHVLTIDTPHDVLQHALAGVVDVCPSPHYIRLEAERAGSARKAISAHQGLETLRVCQLCC